MLKTLAVPVALACCLTAAGASEDMFPFAIKANGTNPAMDMSFLLPAPAGRDGFIRTEGEHFVNDAGRIRFNGVNLVGAACFPDHENAERLAERLSRLGLNIVRVHYIDTWAYGSNFMKAPMAALFKKDPKSNCIVDEAQRERFEYLVAQLKKRGLYLNMNLHVAHELDERDGIPKTPWANRGPDFFYGPLIEKEKEYARDVLSHVNPYTGLALKDDPCVAMVEINNENGMFSTWANGLLDGALRSDGVATQCETFGPVYQDEFRRQWQSFSGSSKDYLRAKAPGPAYTTAETNTFFRFLAHVDETYFNTMRDCLVRELGVKVPVYATQLDYCTPHTLAKYDIVDIHLYWTHPSWGDIPKGINLRQGPHRGVPWMFRNESMIASKRYEKPYDEDFVPHRATMRVKGRPFMVSETASPYPNWYGAEFNPFVRALAAFQDWGAVITHSWNNDLEPEPDYTTFFFSFAGRTDCLAHFPAMAAMFLRGDVRPAAERIDVNEDAETYYNRLAAKGLARAGVHASPARISGGKFRSSEILMRGIGVDLAGASAPFRPLEAKTAAEMDGGVYDNGQFRLDQSDPQHAFFLVRSPNTKFFTGFASMRTFDLGDGVKVTPGTTKLGWCTISLVSLTGNGFGRGSRILLAATGLSHNGGAKFSHLEGSLWHSRDDDFGTDRTVTEGVRATVELPFAGARCWALDENGARGREAPVVTEDGVSSVEIGPEHKTVWYEVETPKAVACAVASVAGADVDLSGAWTVTGKDLSGEVRLPGTLADHRLGKHWLAKDYAEAIDPEQATAMTREYQYLGKAVYSRAFDIEEDGEYELFIERVIWATAPTVDGRAFPEDDVLGAPHVHRLGRLTKGTHRLEVAVDNSKRYGFSGSSHAYGASMQSVWHGMLGKIAIRKVNPLDGIRVKAAGDGKLYLSKIPAGLSPIVEIEGLEVSGVERTEGAAVCSFTRAPELWSDCSPRLYHLRLSAGPHVRELTVGFRTFVAGKGRHHIELNGRKIFTRCNVENCNFARTGSPWMTKEEWAKMIRTLRDEDGINAIRFHTWCPPECAFEAADELGVFLQPECGIWSDGWMGEGVDHVGYGKPVDDFARREFKAISDAYGAHPSFLSLSIGNELGKSEWTEANRMVGEMKAYDDRFLHYFCSAREIMDNDEMVLTHRDFKRQVTIRERLFPKTDWDYEADYAAIDRPTVAHEIGQWPVYPDFDKLIADCDGVIRPYNFERFRAVAVKENALRFQKEYEDASAALNRLIYKEEVESFLRTPSCAGLQLLNIQDYTGQAEALVGWRDPFYELKRPFRGWPAFNTVWGERNYLARFAKYEWTVGETFTAKLVYRNLSGAAVPAGTEMAWSCAGRTGTVRTERAIEPCEVAEVGAVAIPLDAAMTASRQTLVFGTNRWSFWVYPIEEACAFPADVVVTKDFAEMKAALADGRTVLYRGDSRACGRANFKPVYWSTGWFMSKDVIKDQLGTWFETKNPIFDGFVTEFFTDWQWYELAQGQVIHGLTGLPASFRPAALSVNDFHSSKFASPLFELGVGKGRLVVCGYDLDKANPSARRLRAAIAGHLARPAAKDLTRVGLAWLDSDFAPVKAVAQKKRADGIDASRIIYSKDFDWSGRSFTHEFSLDEPENGILEIVFDAKKSQGLARCYIEDHVVNTPGDDGEWVARAMIIREDMLDRKIVVRVQSITPLNVAIRQIRLVRQ